MFKTGGFMTEEKAASAANAFEAATQSLILQKAKENLKAENLQRSGQTSSSTTSGGTPTIQMKDSDLKSNRDELEVDEIEFDDDDELSRLREARLYQLKNQQKQMVDNLQKGHGKYEEIVEDQFLQTVTSSKYTVVHFYHRDFERCKIIDMHLGNIVQKHLPCRFVRIDAEKAPFFVGKLAVRMLPTIVCFIDGVAVDRVVGFEELGGKDDFSTIRLEARLAQANVIATDEAIRQYKMEQNSKKATIQRRAANW
jgi:thiol-disulfide isomerase/thioredoxin